MNGYLDKFLIWNSLQLPKEALNALRKIQFTIGMNFWNTLQSKVQENNEQVTSFITTYPSLLAKLAVTSLWYFLDTTKGSIHIATYSSCTCAVIIMPYTVLSQPSRWWEEFIIKLTFEGSSFSRDQSLSDLLKSPKRNWIVQINESNPQGNIHE